VTDLRCRPAFVAAGIAVFVTAGCATRPVAVPPPAPAHPGITLRNTDRVGFDETLQEHRGEVVLADFWATWCVPCREQLPHTVDMVRRLGDRGLAVITVSLDELAKRDDVLKFLQAQGAVVVNLLSDQGGTQAAYDAFDIEGGALPFYRLYDRKGVARYTFANDPLAKKQFTPADIERRVEELLAEQ